MSNNDKPAVTDTHAEESAAQDWETAYRWLCRRWQRVDTVRIPGLVQR
ncbi:hypothetical protein P9A06_24135 [Serratia marcescens]